METKYVSRGLGNTSRGKKNGVIYRRQMEPKVAPGMTQVQASDSRQRKGYEALQDRHNCLQTALICQL